jgi:hypothetical protein
MYTEESALRPGLASYLAISMSVVNRPGNHALLRLCTRKVKGEKSRTTGYIIHKNTIVKHTLQRGDRPEGSIPSVDYDSLAQGNEGEVAQMVVIVDDH